MKAISEYGWALWLGVGVSTIFKTNFLHWEWWAFCLPLIILVVIYKKYSD